MAHPLFSDILPADSTAASEVTSALGKATKPLDLDVNHLFSRAMMEDWLNAGINFGIRVVLAILLFLVGRWVIRRLLRIFASLSPSWAPYSRPCSISPSSSPSVGCSA